MDIYTYEVITQGNYGYCDRSETTNWQDAIDLFNTGKLRGSCEIIVNVSYTQYSKYVTEVKTVLRNVNDIQGWSFNLMDLRKKEEPVEGKVKKVFNRVERRIMKEMQQEEDGMKIVETDIDNTDVSRENNTDIAEYRVFNVSMREMQIRTTDFEQAFEVWREGEAATGDRWTLLVMPAHNSRKLYLQGNAVHEYHIAKWSEAEAVHTNVGMVKPDFHGDFSAMDKWTQEQIINPKHYKIIPAEAYSKHPEGLEYMDVMGYALSHLSGVEAHTMGHVFKYAFRIGKKDAKLQDAKKIAWYANRMVEILEYPEEIDDDSTVKG